MMRIFSKSVTYYFEKLKTLFLVLLIVLCVVQVGILWSTQSSSFPFLSSLFPDSKATSQITVEESKGSYLLPFRMVLSTGFDEDHYLVPNGSKDYSHIWEGAKMYIGKALDTKPQKTQILNEKVWGELAASKPYMVEFKTSIPTDIVKWVLNLKPSSGDGLSGIYKVIISPDDPDNGYTDTLYVRDNRNIYTYSVSGLKTSVLRKQDFIEIYDRLKNDPVKKNYQSAAEKWGNMDKISFSNDMFGPMLVDNDNNNDEAYPSITCTAFSGIEGTDLNIKNSEDYEKIASELFGKSSRNYDYDKDINGSLVFKKADTVYRLYKNSVLEYKYTWEQASTYNLKLLDSYKRAIEFIIDINRQNNFLSNVNVYLSSVEEKSNSYVFKFDYSIVINDKYGEVPIELKNYAAAKGMDNLDSCIAIEANSKRVTHCEMIPLRFKTGKMLNYQWVFVNMYSKAFETYPELNNKGISIKNFGIYYVLSSSSLKDHITPSFVLYTEDNSYVVPLQEKEK